MAFLWEKSEVNGGLSLLRVDLNFCAFEQNDDALLPQKDTNFWGNFEVVDPISKFKCVCGKPHEGVRPVVFRQTQDYKIPDRALQDGRSARGPRRQELGQEVGSWPGQVVQHLRHVRGERPRR